jgi:hypothetical protein
MMGTQRDLALSWPTRRIVQWGVLWGLLLSVAEFFVILPLHNLPLPLFLVWWLTVWPLPLWCLLGCTLLLLARHAERSGAWRMAALGGLAAAFAWSAYQPLHVQVINTFWPDFNTFGPAMALNQSGGAVIISNSASLWAYNLWLSLFYGGLLVAGYALSMRGERTRAALREAALARGRTEALLGELRLQTLQSQIDPTLLLAALDEVQRLYPQHGDRADALLERLVDFLRAAMPGLKDCDSSLQAELHLAQAFARLQALMPLGARWQVEWPRELPEHAFPSLLLLLIMALAGAKDSPRLVARLEDARVSLQVQALGCQLPPQVEQRTRSSLAALSPASRLRVNESPQTQLVIELEPAPSPTEFAHEPRLA